MAQRSGRWRRRIPGFRNHDEEERYESADIAAIYQRAAHQDLSTRNPVIVIPGVMGSKLVASESTRSLWGDFRKGARPDSSDEARLIALPMERGRPLHLLHSLSESDGTLGQIKSKVAGISIRLSFYSDVLSALGVGSYGGSHSVRSKHIPDYHREEGASVAFEFSYDWRRSLDESAARLQQFITQATRFIQLQLGNSDPIKFDIVAHSMGGLVLRYFLQYGGQLLPYDGSLPRLNWVGAEMIETAIIVGTPNGGSIKVLDRLVFGLSKNPVLPSFDPLLLGTMPSLYQLLPRTRHKPIVQSEGQGPTDLLNPEFWLWMQWGLANKAKDAELARHLPGVASASERRDIAIDHLNKCLTNARVFHAAMDAVAPSRPSHLHLHLIAGDAKRTPSHISAARGDRKLQYVRFGPGDGTVLRSSALLDERVGSEWNPRLVSPLQWDSVMFLPSSHMGLTRDPVFINNVLYLLLERPRETLASARTERPRQRAQANIRG